MIKRSTLITCHKNLKANAIFHSCTFFSQKMIIQWKWQYSPVQTKKMIETHLCALLSTRQSSCCYWFHTLDTKTITFSAAFTAMFDVSQCHTYVFVFFLFLCLYDPVTNLRHKEILHDLCKKKLSWFKQVWIHIFSKQVWWNPVKVNFGSFH